MSVRIIHGNCFQLSYPRAQLKQKVNLHYTELSFAFQIMSSKLIITFVGSSRPNCIQTWQQQHLNVPSSNPFFAIDQGNPYQFLLAILNGFKQL